MNESVNENMTPLGRYKMCLFDFRQVKVFIVNHKYFSHNVFMSIYFCLTNVTFIKNCSVMAVPIFVVIGKLSSLNQEQASVRITEYGGLCRNVVSGKTTYLVTGKNPTALKLKAASVYPNIIHLNEEQFLKLIETPLVQEVVGATTAIAEKPSNATQDVKSTNKRKLNVKPTDDTLKKIKTVPTNTTTHVEIKPIVIPRNSTANSNVKSFNIQDMLWVEKYRPLTSSDVIGNENNIRQIQTYLSKIVHSTQPLQTDVSLVPTGTKLGLLLYGPPGIGKTSTAHALCKQYKFQVHEFNASDCRREKELIYKAGLVITSHLMPPAAIIFDEIDGLDGRDDRGGTIAMLRLLTANKNRIPIICICNDASAQKLKPIIKVLEKIQFVASSKKDIVTRLKYIVSKEVPTLALNTSNQKNLNYYNQMIETVIGINRGDLRKSINHLQLIVSTQTDQKTHNNGMNPDLDISISFFECVRQMLIYRASSTGREIWLDELLQMFNKFFDIVPLLIHENYIKPLCSVYNQGRGKSGNNIQSLNVMNYLADAADSISFGDEIENQIQSNQLWELHDYHGVFSSVSPAFRTSECLHFGGGSSKTRFEVNFPVYLGKLQTRGKQYRVKKMEYDSLIATNETIYTFRDMLLDKFPQKLVIDFFNHQK